MLSRPFRPSLPSRRRGWFGLVGGVAVGLLAGASVVGAQGGGTIYACVFDNPTGPNTRIVAEAGLPCPERSVLTSWAVQGPPGAKGETGAPGPKGQPGATGAQGPAGPVGAAGTGVAWGTFKDGFKSLKPNKATSLQLKLPEAGLYAVDAKAAFQGDNYNCTLRRADKPASAYHDESFGSGGAGTVYLHVLYDFPAGGVAKLKCFNYGNKLATVSQRKITAIKLGGFLNLGN